MSDSNVSASPDMAGGVLRQFAERFGGEPVVVRSPGRVNIIGEHTDYNEGFVLPAAVDKGIYAAISRREDDQIHLYAMGPGQQYTGSIGSLRPVKHPSWANYILGVASQLQERGYTIGGFNAVFDGNVPSGAGMSSSAALECAFVYGLNELFGLQVPRLDMVQMAQKAEHTFAGVMCGIMDQFASMYGKKDHLIQLDCRSLDYEYIPIKMEGYRLVLFNSNVKHSLADSGYNERREQCLRGVQLLQQVHPEVMSLRDATAEMLDTIVQPADELVWRRCRYVVDENARLLDACAALKGGDLATLGRRMFEAHEAMRTMYEISCPEIDFLIDAVKGREEVPGARMMGGGFGGCTINLVQEDAIDGLIRELGPAYRAAMGREMTSYIVQTDNGTSIIS